MEEIIQGSYTSKQVDHQCMAIIKQLSGFLGRKVCTISDLSKVIQQLNNFGPVSSLLQVCKHIKMGEYFVKKFTENERKEIISCSKMKEENNKYCFKVNHAKKIEWEKEIIPIKLENILKGFKKSDEIFEIVTEIFVSSLESRLSDFNLEEKKEKSNFF